MDQVRMWDGNCSELCEQEFTLIAIMAVGFIGVYDIMERVIGKVQVQTKSVFKKGQA